ncbi:MAG: 4-(cytidine 5'-diphospho)-2-C-methyl-D-erythritol kinase [bacterium]
MIKILAPAKINLGLAVYRRREDGYHEIGTLFQAVDVCDELEMRVTDQGIDLDCEGEPAPEGRENIAWQAAELFFSHLGSRPGVHMRLRKHIPVAAGLGGGSSDAAAVLKGLNQLHFFPISEDDLLEMGAQLGADVPFFLFGSSALGQGIGTRLTRTAPLSEVWVVIVNPGFPISTKWVYNHIDTDLLLTKEPDHIKMLRLFLKKRDLPQIGLYLHNDLESVVRKKYPIIDELKNRLLSAGAVGAIMSGSGASVFGIFSDYLRAKKAYSCLKTQNDMWKVFLTRPYVMA